MQGRLSTLKPLLKVKDSLKELKKIKDNTRIQMKPYQGAIGLSSSKE